MDNPNQKFLKLIKPVELTKQLLDAPTTLIVLDTNTLIDLTRQSVSIVKRLKEEFSSSEATVMVPAIVAWEYAMNASKFGAGIGTKSDEEDFKSGIRKPFEIISNKAKNLVSPQDVYLGNTPEFEGLNTTLQQQLKSVQRDLISKVMDAHKQAVDKLKQIGEQAESSPAYISEMVELYLNPKDLNQQWIDSVESDGIERYKEGVGPGFSDEKKKGALPRRRFGNLSYAPEYGDLLIWKETCEFLEAHSKIDQLIFVTKDGLSKEKQDLYWKGDSTLGPSPFLLGEVYEIHQTRLVISPINTIIDVIDPKNDYRLMQTNIVDPSPDDNQLAVASDLESEIKQSDIISSEIEQEIDENVPEADELFGQDFQYAEVEVNDLEIFSVDVENTEMMDLHTLSFGASVSASFQLYSAIDNPMFERGDDDGEPEVLDNQLDGSFSAELTGVYSMEDQDFDDIVLSEVECDW